MIFRSTARGTLMGNRGGCLHNREQEIVRQYKGNRWLICVLEFKGRHRTVMSPGLYTELFFLDEAVALAAGHRPCAECQRERFNAFKQSWAGWAGSERVNAIRATEIDAELHRSRLAPKCSKLTYRASLDSLPDGCFVQIEDSSYVLSNEALLLWSPEGYRRRQDRPRGITVTVLTPEPTVRCLQQGYRPVIHDSRLEL